MLGFEDNPLSLNQLVEDSMTKDHQTASSHSAEDNSYHWLLADSCFGSRIEIHPVEQHKHLPEVVQEMDYMLNWEDLAQARL